MIRSKSPRPPCLFPSVKTPAGEVAAIKDLHANLWGISFNIDAWSSTLSLYDYAKSFPLQVSRQDARHWKFIAAHASVLELHHLRERLKMIKAHKIRNCPSILPKINKIQLKDATNRFDEYFPGIDQLRHAVAHAGANDVTHDQHKTQDGILKLGFTESDQYSLPYKGITYTLSISELSKNRLHEVAQIFFDAFEPAALELELEGFID